MPLRAALAALTEAPELELALDLVEVERLDEAVVVMVLMEVEVEVLALDEDAREELAEERDEEREEED